MYQSKWAPKSAETVAKSEEPRPASSSLSAAAPTFSPAPLSPGLAAPPPDVSSVDTFAQTGAAQDTLFDDVIPLDESMRVRSDDDLFSDDFTPVAQPVVQQPAPAPGRSRGEGQRGRGRGQARERARAAAPTRSDPVQMQNTPSVQESGQAQPQDPKQTEAAPAETALPQRAPTGPRKESVASVRGDRQATGGVRKPKLTEDELAEKMARISIKNASLTAAHARAEADAASFAEREEQAKHVASLRQKEERRDRQQMMGERERNRMRKLKAMEGREWDAEKKEEDFQRGGRFDKRGGFAGDKEDYNDGREYLLRESRGGEGGRRGGRGARAAHSQEQRALKQEDFPALTAPKAGEAVANDEAAGKTSWADQVESSNA